MAAQSVLIIAVLPHDEIALEVRYASENDSGPVRLARCDLLYAMLCDEGVSISIPGKLISGGEGDV